MILAEKSQEERNDISREESEKREMRSKLDCNLFISNVIHTLRIYSDQYQLLTD